MVFQVEYRKICPEESNNVYRAVLTACLWTSANSKQGTGDFCLNGNMLRVGLLSDVHLTVVIFPGLAAEPLS